MVAAKSTCNYAYQCTEISSIISDRIAELNQNNTYDQNNRKDSELLISCYTVSVLPF